MNTHRLWVGSFINDKLCVYRYLTRREANTGMFDYSTSNVNFYKIIKELDCMHDKIGLTHDNTVYMHDTTELIDTIGNDK